VQHWLLGPQVWPPAQQTLPQHCAPAEQMVPPHEKEPEDAHTLLMQLPAGSSTAGDAQWVIGVINFK
jgi:hypothetical protein